jgi:hypothetical protein
LTIIAFEEEAKAMRDLRNRSVLNVLLVSAFWICQAGFAHAVDGVVEINQVRANAGLVTPADTPSFPVTISLSGSYRLTGNLLVTNVDTTAIEITVPNVTLDLNGFEIRYLFPGTGTGVGITTDQENVSILNGTIRGMGSHGILVQNPNGKRARIEGIRAINNGGTGIFASSGSTVTNCTAVDNETFGIGALGGSVLTGNVANFNALTGFSCSSPNTECVFIGNHARANGLYGFEAGSGSTAYQNGGAGIFASGGANVSGNAVRSNTGNGLSLSSSAAYRDNVINGNTAGTVSGGVNMGSNSCNGTTTCP